MVGPKRPPTPKHLQATPARPELAEHHRDLTRFDMARHWGVELKDALAIADAIETQSQRSALTGGPNQSLALNAANGRCEPILLKKTLISMRFLEVSV